MIRLFPVLAIVLMLGPVVAGLAGTLLPAFGWFPALGGDRFGLEPFRRVFDQPGIGTSVALSFGTGLLATGLSLALAVGFVAASFGTPLLARIGRLISPMLSIPHATLALGLAFLLAPSGWLVRMVSPWATGWAWPPDLLILNDPQGLSLVLGLVLKEAPFLFLMLAAALDRLDAPSLHSVARSLGYAPMTAWIKVILPQIYPRLRLPVLAVLAFSTSVVDLSVILGPATPAPLAVRVVTWANDPDLSMRFLAAAGAVVQICVAAAAIGLWILAEHVVAVVTRGWLSNGGRGRREGMVRHGAICLTLGASALSVLALLGLVFWSVADTWRFPDAIPSRFSLGVWSRAEIWEPLATTVIVALLSAGIAAIVTVGCLEFEIRRDRRPSARMQALLYLPLLVPQVAFLLGVQILLVWLRLDGSWLALIWAHLVFVLPYVFLSMAGPWRRFDRRWIRLGRSLGEGPNQVLFRVTLPMLARPVLTGVAVGISVSVAQYLPTLFAGAGRLTTLTTEAVALSSGGDRRIIGVYGWLQMVLPLIAFLMVRAVPGWIFRPGRGTG